MPQAPYHGYKAGDVIGDHDVALAYVLAYDMTAMPCIARLPPIQLTAVRFALGKMHYNHGWLVQAEAPPSALFTPLKGLIEAGGVRTADVAFYFVHWLTDLAGAVPTPLRGAEQLSLRFPAAVLSSIVRTLHYVQRLAYVTETALLEEYLHEMWLERLELLGDVPSERAAIALMRLVVQAIPA